MFLSTHQEEQSKLESRSEELQRQNTLLHEQIQTLSGQMASQLQRATTESQLNVSLTEEGKSQEQLLEILRSFVFSDMLLISLTVIKIEDEKEKCRFFSSFLVHHSLIFAGLYDERRRLQNLGLRWSRVRV